MIQGLTEVEWLLYLCDFLSMMWNFYVTKFLVEVVDVDSLLVEENYGSSVSA
jgi:hypothetical protein